MKAVWPILLILLLSSTKFQFAFAIAGKQGYDFISTLFLTTMGGISGVLFFSFLSDRVIHFFRSFKKLIFNRAESAKQGKKKKLFNWKSRALISLIRRFGLPGVAFITPSVLSIPLGTFIASRINAKFVHSKRKMLGYLFLSVVFWALVFTGVIQLF